VRAAAARPCAAAGADTARRSGARGWLAARAFGRDSGRQSGAVLARGARALVVAQELAGGQAWVEQKHGRASGSASAGTRTAQNVAV
jgi:hypothetical protein